MGASRELFEIAIYLFQPYVLDGGQKFEFRLSSVHGEFTCVNFADFAEAVESKVNFIDRERILEGSRNFTYGWVLGDAAGCFRSSSSSNWRGVRGPYARQVYVREGAELAEAAEGRQGEASHLQQKYGFWDCSGSAHSGKVGLWRQ